MPKLKTRTNAAKRFKYTGAGKLMRTKQMASHLRRHKSKRSKNMFGDRFPIAPADEKRISRLIPYGA
jgi:large subunit ribosomal protein L35